ncbi:unnamed protein product [Heterobilharzia americana]|nr:unnamed protein product [Heterobilharzia americana]
MGANKLVKRRNKKIVFQSLFNQIVCRSNKLYKGSVTLEENLLHLLDFMDKCRKKWRSVFVKLYSILCVQRSEVKRLKNLQAHTQSMFEAESQKRSQLERSKRSLERKVNIIRKVLLVNDIERAKRHLETIDQSTSKINQSCNEDAQNDCSENSTGNASTSIDTIPFVNKGRTSAYVSGTLCRTSTADHNGIVRRSATRQELRSSAVQKFILRRSRDNCFQVDGAQRLGIINRLNRPHNFVSRTVLRMEVCSACGRRITFGKASYKCLVCRLVVHPACRQKLTQTCVPPSMPNPVSTFQPNFPSVAASQNTSVLMPVSPKAQPHIHGSTDAVSSSPKLPSRRQPYSINLSSLCPPDQFPCIPALVIHCVNEVMVRGMTTVGLYRVSGSEKQVKNLFEKFLHSRTTPSLALIEDIHVICGCLKLFLRSLEEPLVTYHQRPNLVSASKMYTSHPNKAHECVLDVLKNLPTPNRHTLSFIMLHLKTICKTPACKMDEENFSKVFGPTLAGYSCPAPHVMQAISETKPQQDVVRLLFSVSGDVYSSILSDWNDGCGNGELCDSYFKTLVTDMNLSQQTTSAHCCKPIDMRVPARKGFLPNFLTSLRDPPK